MTNTVNLPLRECPYCSRLTSVSIEGTANATCDAKECSEAYIRFLGGDDYTVSNHPVARAKRLRDLKKPQYSDDDMKIFAKEREFLEDQDLSNFRDMCATPERPKSLLEQASLIVNGARRQEYGHPKNNFADIADIWTVLLETEVTPLQVIECMIALKLCRAKQSGWSLDTFMDIAGYSQCAELIQE